VRGGVAKNPNTPIKLLQELAKDKDEYVRRDVARNPNTPIKLLQELAKDEDRGVRISVAKNPNTPIKLLEELAEDYEEEEDLEADLTYAGSIYIDSGQAMVGDPCHLDKWDTSKTDFNINNEDSLIKYAGRYSYAGVCATTTLAPYGQINGGWAVAFNTGQGDGEYPVYVELDDDDRVQKVIIDFTVEGEKLSTMFRQAQEALDEEEE
jgi:hypothetical protein